MANRIVLDYKPTSKQVLFHRSAVDETLYGGAAGGGKSHAAVMDALAFALQHRNTHTYLFRRTYPELEDSLIRTALTHYPEGLGRYISGTHDWRLPNGSELHFRHCKSVDDVRKYQGAEINRLYIDELTHWEKGMYDFIKTRLRANTALNIKPIAKLTTNPGGIGHSWVKLRFIDAMPQNTVLTEKIKMEMRGGDEVEVSRIYIPALATDNPYINDEYLIELMQKPAKLRDAYLYGKWDAFEGQVFAEFTDNPDGYESRRNTHVIDPFQIPHGWPRFRAMDWGYAAPFAIIWAAVSPDNTVYIYREWYGCEENSPNVGVKMSATDVAQGIRKIEREYENGNQITGIADPHIFDNTTGDSVGDIMARNGVYFIKGNNSRLLGWAQIHDRLRFDSDGYPQLYITSNCRECIRTIQAVPYATTKGKIEDVDTSSEDHLADALRYMLMERPLGRKPPVVLQRKPYNPLER